MSWIPFPALLRPGNSVVVNYQVVTGSLVSSVCAAMSEEGENLVASGPSFKYPPFQKALPYFPNYGYQATIHLDWIKTSWTPHCGGVAGQLVCGGSLLW